MDLQIEVLGQALTYCNVMKILQRRVAHGPPIHMARLRVYDIYDSKISRGSALLSSGQK